MNRFKYVQRSEHTKVGGEGKEETFDFCNLSPSSVIQSFICGYVSIAKLNLLLKEDKTISFSFLKWDERVTQPNKRREEKQIQVADSSHLKDVQAATHLDPLHCWWTEKGMKEGGSPGLYLGHRIWSTGISESFLNLCLEREPTRWDELSQLLGRC